MAAFCDAKRIALIKGDAYSPPGDSAAQREVRKALKAWDRTGNVIYCASSSKVLIRACAWAGWLPGAGKSVCGR